MVHEEHRILMILSEGEKKMWEVIAAMTSHEHGYARKNAAKATISNLITRLISEKKVVRTRGEGTRLLRLHGGNPIGGKTAGTTPRL